MADLLGVAVAAKNIFGKYFSLSSAFLVNDIEGNEI